LIFKIYKILADVKFEKTRCFFKWIERERPAKTAPFLLHE